MAEKEERIMIVADEPYYCNSCKKINNCSKDCKGYIEWFNRPDPIRHFYSKSEAINHMAKAMYAFTWKSRTPMVRVQNWEIGVTEQNKKKYLGLAEAGLNALLSK